MNRGWYWRLGLVLASLVASFVILWPSIPKVSTAWRTAPATEESLVTSQATEVAPPEVEPVLARFRLKFRERPELSRPAPHRYAVVDTEIFRPTSQRLTMHFGKLTFNSFTPASVTFVSRR